MKSKPCGSKPYENTPYGSKYVMSNIDVSHQHDNEERQILSEKPSSSFTENAPPIYLEKKMADKFKDVDESKPKLKLDLDDLKVTLSVVE